MNDNAKHTPGPWEATHIVTRTGQEVNVIWPKNRTNAGQGQAIAFLAQQPHDRLMANGQLLAAAPELLDALKRLHDHAASRNDDYDAVTHAERIIAKATGN